MSGWSHQKRVAVESAFYEFLKRCYVNSKDAGRICLGDSLFDGQTMFITSVFNALEADIHKIFVLKSRQLGISTIARALTIFLLGVHAGLKGSIVFDTDNNKNESRAEIEVMIEDLPNSLKFPRVIGSNRTGLTLQNNSKILFMSAGVRKSKTSGTLGRSVGLSLSHLSEICSYDNDEGLEAFEQSLSDINPDRLYIYESTARGFNRWFEMWKEARADPAHCVCLFLGWWSKPSQRIDRDEPDWELYGVFPPTEREAEKIKQVKELYDFAVSQEQLAWVRRKMDPTAHREGDANPEYEGSTTRVQEQPWTEEEAFQQTGTIFFPAEKLTDLTNKWANNTFKTYMFITGTEFIDMAVIKAENTKSIDLKVWEEPDTTDGVYCIACDPAYGENEMNCRSSIQVLRCYADGIDQVAEYASAIHNTRQLAWIIACLLGWYGAGKAECRYILELAGGGTAAFNELRGLRLQLESGYQPREVAEKGLQDIFRNVRTYIYTRPDAMGMGQNFHFKTNAQLKVTIMNRLRDFVTNGMLHVRSFDAIEEMRTVAQEGDSIKAPGSMKDDRVVALALGVYYWETSIRKQMMVQRRTREAEAAKKRLSIVDQVQLFSQNQLQDFFAQKQRIRTNAAISMMRQRWRYGR